MANLFLLLWAVIPPLLLLWFYYRRIPVAPTLLQIFLFFILGAISGCVAWGLEWAINWQLIKRSLPIEIVRQLVAIAPIEEGCKLLAVLLPTYYLQHRYHLRATSVFLFTIAVALGFTAEENVIYLLNGQALIIERTIGTPVHILFSAPWGYAWAIYIASTIRFSRDINLIPLAWVNSVICHALVNILSIAWGYPPPLSFLTYALFPFLLWMLWRLEQLLRKLQGKHPISLITGYRYQQRFWQRVLVLFILLFGGNAIFGLFNLARKLSPLRPIQLFYPDFFKYIATELVVNLILGIVAVIIYRYLRDLAKLRGIRR